MKRKKNRRIHKSTFYVVTAALLIGITALTFTYTFAWGKKAEADEKLASENAFEVFETETIYGETFTNEDIAGPKLIAFNVWETT